MTDTSAARDLQFECASSLEDVDQAICVARDVFENASPIQPYDEFKRFLWTKDPSFAIENLVVARQPGGDVVGMVRIVPRVLCRGEDRLSVAGISSVCLADRFRGSGFSIPLMDCALDTCQSRGFDLSLLFARRAVDGYYRKFGYWGISSYEEVTVRLPTRPVQRKEIRIVPEFDVGLIDVYGAAYDHSYASCFGRLDRTPSQWSYLGDYLNFLSDIEFLTMYDEETPIGYVVRSEEGINEAATTDGATTMDVLKALEGGEGNALQLHLPSSHEMVASLDGVDATVSQRECRFGGHMALILNPDTVLRQLETRLTRACQFPDSPTAVSIDQLRVDWDGRSCRATLTGSDTRQLSFRVVRSLLGVSTPLVKGTFDRFDEPFNVSLADRF